MPSRVRSVGLVHVRGALLVGGVTALASLCGHFLPAVGAPAIALVLGMVIRLVYEPPPAVRGLLTFGSRTVLQTAIVVLGTTFSLGRVMGIGRSSLPVMLGTFAAALVATWLVGRLLRVAPRLQVLVGIGTAICGASAISAVSGALAATEAEIAYAISTIFVFNVVAVVLYPALGHALGLSQRAFGLWAGTAINDTSSVVAAAYTYGHSAGGVAVVTKLARTTLIIPTVLVLLVFRSRGRTSGERTRWTVVPPFLVFFLLASALNTAGILDARWDGGLVRATTILITVALA
jgi:uncharacterized integral membrane protein (TIGR00698 family)